MVINSLLEYIHDGMNDIVVEEVIYSFLTKNSNDYKISRYR